MRMSQLLGRRFKERPADAVTESDVFLLRGGHGRQCAPGSWAWFTPAQRIRANILEHLATTAYVLQAQSWCLPPATVQGYDEEVRLVARELSSYAELPARIAATRWVAEAGATAYTQWRLMYFEEHAVDTIPFLMKELKEMGFPDVRAGEAAPLPRTEASAHVLYVPCPSATTPFLESATGMYRASADYARFQTPANEADIPKPLEKVATPACKTIAELAAFLNIAPAQTAKAVMFTSGAENALFLAMIRGDRDVSEAKVAALAGGTVVPATDDAILATGLVPGYASPLGIALGRVTVLLDHSIADAKDLVTGANDAGFHYLHFCPARDLPSIHPVDIARARAGDTARDGGLLQEVTGIPLARIATLSQAYLETHHLGYDTSDATHKIPEATMATIRVEALIHALVETRHDAYGPIFPAPFAPWRVHICAIKRSNPDIQAAADTLYHQLLEDGLDPLYDDRDARPGVQFADADLIGIPWRLIVGERALANGEIEWKRRDTGEKGSVAKDAALDLINSWMGLV